MFTSIRSLSVSQAVRGMWWLRTCWLTTLLLVMSWVGACDQNLQPPPLAEPEDLYWDLELNQHAVTLATAAPYDTLTLTAVPRNHQGDALAGLPAPTYTSMDIEHVLVTPEGRLIAVKETHLTKVIATLTVDNLTHRDTVWVKVVADPDPPGLATFSAHPIPPDSAKVAANVNGVESPCDSLPLRATDVNGNAMDGLPVSVRFSDSTVAGFGVNQGPVLFTSAGGCHISGVRPGNVTIYATLTVFGVTKTDTLPYRVGWPLLGFVDIVPTSSGLSTFFQPEVRIGTGGIIVWTKTSLATAINVTFADPTNVAGVDAVTHDAIGPHEQFPYFCAALQADCGSGDIVISPGSGFAAFRTFTAPGTYEFSISDGARSTILVVND